MKLIAYICFLIRRISEKGKSYSPMLIILGSVIILTISLSAVIMSYFINNANSNFLLMFSGLKSIYIMGWIFLSLGCLILFYQLLFDES